MFSAINYFSSQYLASLAGKTSLQNKSRLNQVCEVRLIPGLKLFCFQEYRPIGFEYIVISLTMVQNRKAVNLVTVEWIMLHHAKSLKKCPLDYDHCQVNWFKLPLLRTTDQIDNSTKSL